MGRCKGKGSSFERQLCKMLSLWWSNGKRDDLYWRSSMSGGRATVRARKSKSTAGHYGDITSTDTVGRELTQLCVIEAKRGYQEHTVGDLVDATPANKPQFEDWVEQAMEEQELAGTPGWLLITKRNNREIMVYMPWKFYHLFSAHGVPLYECRPYLKFLWGECGLFGTTLNSFLKVVTPDIISGMVEEETEED